MSEQVVVRQRRRVVVDQSALARAIGGRIRAARLAAGLTQQELAGDRYTKAYVSALELGHAKPSMAALDYLAPRLGTTPDRLLADPGTRWTRVDADLHLAAGRHQQAADAYLALAEDTQDPVRRGELLLGAGEALARLRLPRAAQPWLIEAGRLLERGGSLADRVRCRYWTAWLHHALHDTAEAHRLLLGLLELDLDTVGDPDLELRVRIAIASIEGYEGRHDQAALYLEEARGRIDRLDIRRRAVYFDVLSTARSNAGDNEGAIRAGLEAITLYAAVNQEIDVATIENQLALSFLDIGNAARAEELAGRALVAAESAGQWALTGHVLDTLARVRLAGGDAAEALALADRSIRLEASEDLPGEQIGARVTRARALGDLGRHDEADTAWREAAAVAETPRWEGRRTEVFGGWADALAARGRHAEAYEVARRAL